MSIKRGYFAKPFDKFWLLNTDSSSLFRPYSKSLANRGYVYKPNNQVKGNKPVDVGYEFSTVSLSARCPLYGLSEAPWNLPLSMRLIPFDANRNSFTAKQVNDLLDNEELPFEKELVVNALDSKYSAPEYIADTHSQAHLVNIIRLASNRNVWKKLSEQEQKQRRKTNADKRRADAIYGQQYKLSQAPEWDLAPDTEQEFGIQLANGRKVIVRMALWHQMMIHSKRGKSMKDKPFDLVKVELLDGQSREALFQRPMWLGVWGKRRAELSLDQIYWAYRNRFDIEHFFRFGKQRLLLNQFQTPEQDHWQNWLEVVNCAYWLLWVASDQASHQTKKWQQYDKNVKKRKQYHLRPSPSQVQQQLESIILAFEQEPFLPKLQ
ncbi:MAG: transposase [Bacteroidota bacterium]